MKLLIPEALQEYSTLNKHAPVKKKYLLANHTNFVTKDLWKEIMLRSRLQNISLKEKSLESKKGLQQITQDMR